MELINLTATVIEEDMKTSDPLASAIDRAIYLRTNDKVKVKVDKTFCIGMFECSSEVSRVNNPLILNGPQSKPTVRKPVNEVGDEITFRIWW